MFKLHNVLYTTNYYQNGRRLLTTSLIEEMHEYFRINTMTVTLY